MHADWKFSWHGEQNGGGEKRGRDFVNFAFFVFMHWQLDIVPSIRSPNVYWASSLLLENFHRKNECLWTVILGIWECLFHKLMSFKWTIIICALVIVPKMTWPLNEFWNTNQLNFAALCHAPLRVKKKEKNQLNSESRSNTGSPKSAA